MKTLNFIGTPGNLVKREYNQLKVRQGQEREAAAFLRSNGLREGDIIYFGLNPQAFVNGVEINKNTRYVNCTVALVERNKVFSKVVIPFSLFTRAGFEAALVERVDPKSFPIPTKIVNPNFLRLGILDIVDIVKGKMLKVNKLEPFLTTSFNAESGQPITRKDEVTGKEYLVVRTSYSPLFSNATDYLPKSIDEIGQLTPELVDKLCNGEEDTTDTTDTTQE